VRATLILLILILIQVLIWDKMCNFKFNKDQWPRDSNASGGMRFTPFNSFFFKKNYNINISFSVLN